LGAIYPAMANSVMMYDLLGYAKDHPDYAIARLSVEKLLVVKDDEAYCQPCVSPVWDTALVAHALLEARTPQFIARSRSSSSFVTTGTWWTTHRCREISNSLLTAS
jgi:squalene-hopene/tetraprenyl-beta-curcumene cyclase